MYGIVFEGGGTRGSYEIGAYEALLDCGIEVGAIVGTSIGAINGAILTQGDLKQAKEIWKHLKPSTIVDMDDEEFEKISSFSFNKGELSDMFNKVKFLIKDGGFDITPLKKNLDIFLDEEKIRASDIDFGLVTYNYSKKEAVQVFKEDIPEGKLIDYILASSALPAFKAVEIDGDKYVDGAIYDNLPFKMLEEKGYKDIIIVRVYGTGIVNKYDDKDYIVIEPREKLGAVMEVDIDKINYNMSLGYYDTLRVFKSYLGDKYYIKNPCTERDAFKFFTSLGEDKITILKEILNINNDKPLEKSLLEDIIPKLDSAFSLKNNSYLDLLIELLEVKALELGLERFKVYEFTDLFNKALVGSTSLSTIEEKGFVEILKDKLFNKGEIVTRAANIIISN